LVPVALDAQAQPVQVQVDRRRTLVRLKRLVVVLVLVVGHRCRRPVHMVVVDMLLLVIDRVQRDWLPIAEVMGLTGGAEWLGLQPEAVVVLEVLAQTRITMQAP